MIGSCRVVCTTWAQQCGEASCCWRVAVWLPTEPFIPLWPGCTCFEGARNSKEQQHWVQEYPRGLAVLHSGGSHHDQHPVLTACSVLAGLACGAPPLPAGRPPAAISWPLLLAKCWQQQLQQQASMACSAGQMARRGGGGGESVSQHCMLYNTTMCDTHTGGWCSPRCHLGASVASAVAAKEGPGSLLGSLHVLIRGSERAVLERLHCSAASHIHTVTGASTVCGTGSCVALRGVCACFPPSRVLAVGSCAACATAACLNNRSRGPARPLVLCGCLLQHRQTKLVTVSSTLLPRYSSGP